MACWRGAECRVHVLARLLSEESLAADFAVILCETGADPVMQILENYRRRYAMRTDCC